IPIQNDGEAQADTRVDASGEDELTWRSNVQQLQSEAQNLDMSNILDDSPGVTTRCKKVDTIKQVSKRACVGLLDDNRLAPLIAFALTGARDRCLG
ncbi:hypothetical protein K437DRAFT_222094, partial [Tilletiaria anomala UBC 951]